MPNRDEDEADEIEYLIGRIRDLERAFATPIPDPTLGLAPAETQFLLHLARRGVVTGERYSSDRECAPEAVRQLVFRVRRKLAPHGVAIKNEKGGTYTVDAESRSTLRALLGL